MPPAGADDKAEPAAAQPAAWVSQQPLLWLAPALGLAHALAAVLSLELSRQPGSVAAIWYANALAVAALAHRGPREWPWLLAAVALGNAAANAAWGDQPLVALSFVPPNLFEIALAAALLRRAGLHDSGIASAAALGLALLLGGLLPSCVAATAALFTVGASVEHGFTGLWLPWVEGGVIGSLSVLPLALLVAREGPRPLLALAGNVPAWAMACAAVGATLMAAALLPFSLVYATLPLLAAALVLPLAGAYLLTLMVSVTLAAALGTGLLVPPPLSAAWQQVFVYLAVAAALLPGQLLATSLHELRRSRERLAKRTQALRRANEGLEQFMHFSAHDLREPLNTIASFGGLLQEDAAAGLDEGSRRHLALMLQGTQRMRTLLDDMLQYVSVQQGEPPPLQPVDLDALLQDVREALAQRLVQTGARVDAEPLGQVLGHPAMLHLVLQNLLSNAVKFVEPGRVPEISLRAFDEGPMRVLQVQDNGIGIDPDAAARLFQPFHRLHPRRRYEGTGLGLAITRRILELHGGRIEVQPALGGGSCFTLRLPRPPHHPAGSVGRADIAQRRRAGGADA
jgi:signal transduction histidine kinase